MPVALNEDIAGRLDEVAALLEEQGANRYRVQAYHHAASVLRGLARPASEIFASEGLTGLERLPGIGETIARAIRDMLQHGKLAMLDRLRGEHDPIALLTSVPGIGKALAWKLHDILGLESLEGLENAAHDGRLESFGGIGAKRLAGIRDSLAHRLGGIRKPPVAMPVREGQREPSVAEILEMDVLYRREASSGTLKKIAPRRFNPTGAAWLPVFHTTRGQRHYTALFSNSAHAHESNATHDWVVLYYDGTDGEHQCTVITSKFGFLKGLRIVRGREEECEAYYRLQRRFGSGK